MEMSRLYEDTISGVVRYRGSQRDETGNVVEDLVANDLRQRTHGRITVPAGSVIETTPGALQANNGVRRLFHAAAVQATPGRGYRQISDVSICVYEALTRAISASPSGMTSESVLFPLLGTGHGKGDAKHTATTMYRAIVDFLQSHPASGLSRVCILAYTNRDLEAVQTALDKVVPTGAPEGAKN
jgi:O-acetyl-ADP-ribose deacetylase (regulator of RNase III)